ncbi:hypothetical protein V6N11_050124 [Hibiscus sabdariffa]|uniref:DUF4283 domain-containing protein n=1 Tax=Hibiscus sabdariffa TaxID=183260 RepID=A0ABR2T936_9ROSI
MITIPSYKDSLLHGTVASPQKDDDIFDDEDIELIEGNITRFVVNGLISVDSSERVQKLTQKSFNQMVVIKLLGRCIGYTSLRNKLQELWKPMQAVKLLDIGNEYYLASFKENSDFMHLITEGPWMIFRHYLTVEPWSADFTHTHPKPGHGLDHQDCQRPCIKKVSSQPLENALS